MRTRRSGWRPWPLTGTVFLPTSARARPWELAERPTVRPKPCSDTCIAGTARAGFRGVPARREDAKWTTPLNGRTVGTLSPATWHCCAEGTMPSSPSVPGAMSICPMAAIFDGALRWAGLTAPVLQTQAQWTGMGAASKALNLPWPQSLRYHRHSRNDVVLACEAPTFWAGLPGSARTSGWPRRTGPSGQGFWRKSRSRSACSMLPGLLRPGHCPSWW